MNALDLETGLAKNLKKVQDLLDKVDSLSGEDIINQLNDIISEPK